MIQDEEDGQHTEYWMNGNVQVVELQYVTPPFDSSKLEKVKQKVENAVE